MMAYGIADLPARGDMSAEVNSERTAAGRTNPGNYYIRNAYSDTHTDNMVTVVLADYRSFDTFGETLVVFTAAICVLLILTGNRRETDAELNEKAEEHRGHL